MSRDSNVLVQLVGTTARWVGRWSLVVGRWSLVVGRWLTVRWVVKVIVAVVDVTVDVRTGQKVVAEHGALLFYPRERE